MRRLAPALLLLGVFAGGQLALFAPAGWLRVAGVLVFLGFLAALVVMAVGRHRDPNGPPGQS